MKIMLLSILLFISIAIFAKEINPFKYVLIINDIYQGTYKSCELAFKHRTNENARCINKEYMNLPKSFKHRYIDLKEKCLLRRYCNGKR